MAFIEVNFNLTLKIQTVGVALGCKIENTLPKIIISYYETWETNLCK